MVQVPDMLADKRLATHNQRDCIFQVGAEGQDRTLSGKLPA
jgi:hypothetical protein